MNQVMEQFQPIIIQTAVVIITAVATYVSYYVKKFLQDKINTDVKQTVAKDVVRFVQQVYKDLDGQSKFDEAKKELIEQLNGRGIKITDKEVQILIEAAVNGMKDGLTVTALPSSYDNTTESK